MFSKKQVSLTSKLYLQQLVMDMLFDGMKRAQLYVVRLIEMRREALYYLILRFVKLFPPLKFFFSIVVQEIDNE